MMPKIETSEDDAADLWSTPVNWEEDSAINAKLRRRCQFLNKGHIQANTANIKMKQTLHKKCNNSNAAPHSINIKNY